MTELVFQGTSVYSATPSLPHCNTPASLEQTFSLQSSRSSPHVKEHRDNSVETGWLIKLGCCSSKVILSLGEESYLQTPSLTLVFGLTMSYLSGRFREIEGDFWVMCLRFSADRTDVITGKYPTTLKSVCSLWTSVKFIASLRQIAVNEIAAFWLGTDGKRIVLKKNNCYYPSSVCHLKSGLLQLFSLGYP